jgi:hypothetical protein
MSPKKVAWSAKVLVGSIVTSPKPIAAVNPDAGNVNELPGVLLGTPASAVNRGVSSASEGVP